ncbi:MAG TPA: hypothetical protein VEW48_12445 [Thermoanaerobaculia bacterium]|nr:hypothetical protein [Thermoanaerobaculia bacterium]
MSHASFIGELPSTVFAMAGKGALISLAALGVAAALRRSSAASRHLVLALAAAVLVLLPVLVAALPAWDLPVPRVETGYVPTPAAARPPGVQTPGYHENDRPRGDDAPASPPSGVGFFHGSQGFQSLAGALTISLLLLLRLALALYHLSRLRAGSRPAPAEWQELLDRGGGCAAARGGGGGRGAGRLRSAGR